MSGLVKNIVDLEAEAEAVIEKARVEAREMDNKVRQDIASYQDRIGKEVDARVKAYREEAEYRHARDMADAKRQLEEALAALSGISEQAVRVQVNRILEHCRNL